MTHDTLTRIQRVLGDQGISGWLLYSFRDTNPLAVRLLGLSPEVHQSRRWALFVPASGQPLGLVHRIEPHIGEFMPGKVVEYSTYTEFAQGLRVLLEGVGSVAMEYSPMNNVPVIGRVDAGTVELVRSLGVDVVSSGDLVSAIDAWLPTAAIESARRAGHACREVMMQAFDFIRHEVTSAVSVGEYEVQSFILAEFERRGMVTDHPPIVGVNANSANPHYSPHASNSAQIQRGDFVLIDLWARESAEGSIFGDITWTGYVGNEVPEKYVEVFNIVRDARDAALNLVVESMAAGRDLRGADVDNAARGVIESAGYGEYFTHRTGHSITTELHGAGANIDNFETCDTRRIIPGTSFSIEPGIYLTGRFGIRSELDVLIDHDGRVEATSEPVQRSIVSILSSASR